MAFDLKGKSALVTGSGRGIGRAVAGKLSQCGAAVMLNDIDAAVANEARDVLRSQGAHAESLAGDVTQSDFPNKIVDATVRAFGGIDIIVNNAGYTWDNVIQKMSDEQFQAMLDVHLVAPFRILRAASGWIREAAKREIAEGRRVMRKVVNISSVSGTEGNAGQMGYSAGKAGINGMTKSLAKEWGRYNVTVNSVAFGAIDTRLLKPLTDGAKIEMHGHEILIGVQPQRIASIEQRAPLARLGTAEEAAGPVLFFCSPLSDYVTGEVLTCSGGAHS